MDGVLIGVLIVASLFFLLAVLCEIMDIIKFTNLPTTYSLANVEDQKRISEFYSCYSCTYMVVWRSAYIISFVSAGVLVYILSVMGMKPTIGLFLALLAVMFVASYIYAEFKHYHLYRIMCDRAKFNKPFYTI